MKLLLVSFLSWFSLGLFSQTFTEVFLEDKNKTILVGEITIENLQQDSYAEWYFEENQTYIMNQETLNEINKKSFEGLSVKIFMATWCHDSHVQVPRFMKIIDDLGQQVISEIYSLDTQKECPNIDTHQYGIELVPTFILFKNDVEIGRITETPTLSLEEDFLKIIEKY